MKPDQDIVKEHMAKIRELFSPYNIHVKYSGVILYNDSKINLNEYEWGPSPSSNASNEENDKKQAAGTSEDTLFTKKRIELEIRQEEIRIKRKEAYARQQRKENRKDQEVTPQETQIVTTQSFEDQQNIRSISNVKQETPRYGRTIDVLI